MVHYAYTFVQAFRQSSTKMMGQIYAFAPKQWTFLICGNPAPPFNVAMTCARKLQHWYGERGLSHLFLSMIVCKPVQRYRTIYTRTWHTKVIVVMFHSLALWQCYKLPCLINPTAILFTIVLYRYMILCGTLITSNLWQKLIPTMILRTF